MNAEEARAEYLRRNLLVASGTGVRAGVGAAIDALKCQKRPPKWLLNLLEREVAKMKAINSEMAAHRDELYDAAWKDAF